MTTNKVFSNTKREEIGQPADEVVNIDNVENKEPEPEHGEDLFGEDVYGQDALDCVSMQMIAKHANTKVTKDHSMKDDEMRTVAKEAARLDEASQRSVAEFEALPQISLS